MVAPLGCLFAWFIFQEQRGSLVLRVMRKQSSICGLPCMLNASSTVCGEKRQVQSSAFIIRLQFCTDWAKSFMYRMKRSGPSIDLCSTVDWSNFTMGETDFDNLHSRQQIRLDPSKGWSPCSIGFKFVNENDIDWWYRMPSIGPSEQVMLAADYPMQYE